MTISGTTKLAGVVGNPITHSLSPLLHNAWISGLRLDAAYLPFQLTSQGFDHFIQGLRGGSIAGLNVTLPFKIQALAIADVATIRASRAGAANVLVFKPDGEILADNTDGLGLLSAFAEQSPSFDPRVGPVAILGAGGGAQGAAAAFLGAGCPQVRLINRTLLKAQQAAEGLGDAVIAYDLVDAVHAFEDVTAVVNATSAGLVEGGELIVPLDATPSTTIVMDMVYKPLKTPLLLQAEQLGRPTVDGLAMLIGQARPSFHAFYGQPPPATVDARGLALKALGY